MDKVQAAVADMFKPAKFFSTASKRGEVFELKAELNADTKDKRKDAVKKVIANMTVGKDVSVLFADVVKNMQTDDLEMKKLVYLYLINYAKSQPELVILAINTFVKDVEDPNPLIRSLAMRTMGCLRVQKVIDYICDPLKKTLKDQHPYVRKTAAICVAKLFDLDASLAMENGFLVAVHELLADPNPMVVANAVTALLEIRECVRKEYFTVNVQILQKLLTALNESNEWGQISILEAIALYPPVDDKEAEQIVERVLPRLQHANPAVSMAAVKVLIQLLDSLKEEEFMKTTIKKLAPPLVTLLTAPHEVQYVALKNISLILQKKPDILSNDIRVFFCKYNDPPYVKLEKLEIIVKLAAERNIDQVISELKEYANEVDVDFVRRSVRALGRCAIKIEQATERCVTALLDLLKNKVNYVVQEAIIVIKDIFRKFPNRYEGIIPTLCESLDSLDEPEAKAAMIWIIGENAHRIENANELMEYFLENFKVEPVQVQLQLLTATVKLFLKKPAQGQEIVQRILQTATTLVESADLRDRAYIYWRLLSTDPNAAKAVTLAEKPPIVDEKPVVTPALLNELIRNLATIASVYHKPASTFLAGRYHGDKDKAESDDEGEAEGEGAPAGGAGGDLLDLDLVGEAVAGGKIPSGPASALPANNILDLLDAAPAAMVPTVTPASLSGLEKQSLMLPKQQFLSPQQAKGLELSGTFIRKQGAVHLLLTIGNRTMMPMSDFAIQFNKNSFALSPAGPLNLSNPLPPNQTIDVSVPLTDQGALQKMEPVNLLQIAFKNNIDVFYFQTMVPLHVLFSENGLVSDKAVFMELYQSTTAAAISTSVKSGLTGFRARFETNNVFVVHQTSPNNFFVSVVLNNGMAVVGELIVDSPGSYTINAKTKVPELVPLFKQSIEAILAA